MAAEWLPPGQQLGASMLSWNIHTLWVYVQIPKSMANIDIQYTVAARASFKNVYQFSSKWPRWTRFLRITWCKCVFLHYQLPKFVQLEFEVNQKLQPLCWLLAYNERISLSNDARSLGVPFVTLSPSKKMTGNWKWTPPPKGSQPDPYKSQKITFFAASRAFPTLFWPRFPAKTYSDKEKETQAIILPIRRASFVFFSTFDCPFRC